MRRLFVLPLLALLAISALPLQAQYRWITTQLKHPDYTGGPVKTVALVTLINQVNGWSYTFEAEAMEQLENHHINATPSLDRIATLGAGEGEAVMRSFLKSLGAQAVLITRAIPYGRKKEPLKLPIALNQNPGDVRNRTQDEKGTITQNFYAQVYPSYRIATVSDLWEKSKQVRLEFLLYSLEEEKIIWTAVSAFLPTKKVKKHIPDLTRELANVLHDQQLVVSTQP